jgi:hypothetical protein
MTDNPQPSSEEDVQRSERLFRWLADNEPPQHFDPTIAGTTSPQHKRMRQGSFYVIVQTVKPFFRRYWVQTVIHWLPLVLIILTVLGGVGWVIFRYWF